MALSRSGVRSPLAPPVFANEVGEDCHGVARRAKPGMNCTFFPVEDIGRNAAVAPRQNGPDSKKSGGQDDHGARRDFLVKGQKKSDERRRQREADAEGNGGVDVARPETRGDAPR